MSIAEHAWWANPAECLRASTEQCLPSVHRAFLGMPHFFVCFRPLDQIFHTERSMGVRQVHITFLSFHASLNKKGYGWENRSVDARQKLLGWRLTSAQQDLLAKHALHCSVGLLISGVESALNMLKKGFFLEGSVWLKSKLNNFRLTFFLTRHVLSAYMV